MLMYHPAQDANHCVFRLLLILEHSEHDHIDISVYKLIDFYFLFPHLVNLLKPLPTPINKFRKEFSEIPEPYETLKNTKRILYELEELQSTAIQSLLAKNLLDLDEFEKGWLKRTSFNIQPEIHNALNASDYANQGWFKALINEFPKAKFNGKAGLKSRTGLMEFRYDVETK